MDNLDSLADIARLTFERNLLGPDRKTPTWDSLAPIERDAWIAAVQAVFRAVRDTA